MRGIRRACWPKTELTLSLEICIRHSRSNLSVRVRISGNLWASSIILNYACDGGWLLALVGLYHDPAIPFWPLSCQLTYGVGIFCLCKFLCFSFTHSTHTSVISMIFLCFEIHYLFHVKEDQCLPKSRANQVKMFQRQTISQYLTQLENVWFWLHNCELSLELCIVCRGSFSICSFSLAVSKTSHAGTKCATGLPKAIS